MPQQEGRKLVFRRVREEHVADREASGLRDAGHVYLTCSNCHAVLVDLWRTRPHEPETWKVRATCPFCPPRKNGQPEMSFVQEVQGGFHQGGYGRLKEGDEDVDVQSTVIDRFEVEGDNFVFHTKKATKDAKPLYRRP